MVQSFLPFKFDLHHYVTTGEGLDIPVEGVRAGAVTAEDVAAFARYDSLVHRSIQRSIHWSIGPFV